MLEIAAICLRKTPFSMKYEDILYSKLTILDARFMNEEAIDFNYFCSNKFTLTRSNIIVEYIYSYNILYITI